MNYKVLKLLKETNGYLSGEELGKKLNVSRTAVWKAISKLKEEGYEIEAVTNKGYRLIHEGDILNESEIKQNLNTKYLGQKVCCYDEVDSTNNVARKLALEGYPQGTIVLTKRQNAGKGRMGKIWNSPESGGIWMSMILMPHMQPKEAPLFTLTAGLCVCKAIRKITGLNAEIKWPNDILIKGKKICGILTEMNAEMEKINFIIIGIGINVNIDCFPEELSNVATSLEIESKRKWKRKEIIKELLIEFEKYYELYQQNNDFTIFLDDYKKLCVTIGKNVHVFAKEAFDGKAIDVTKEGELIVEKENGEITVVFSGEVSIREKKDGLL